MKKVLLLMAAMLITLGAYAKSENDVKATFKINPPMSCANCESKIKSNLRFESGVTGIEANAPGDVVIVTYNDKKTNVEKLVTAFSKLGYEAVCDESTPSCGKTVCPEGEAKKELCPPTISCKGEGNCNGKGNCHGNGTCKGEGNCHDKSKQEHK